MKKKLASFFLWAYLRNILFIISYTACSGYISIINSKIHTQFSQKSIYKLIDHDYLMDQLTKLKRISKLLKKMIDEDNANL